jgi:hypothetical protein
LSDGNVDQVDLDTQQVTRIGQIWQPIAPQYWADCVVWSPQSVGNTLGAAGIVLFGSPQGLYAWDCTTVYRPGDIAPAALTGDFGGTLPPTPMPVGLPGIYALEVYMGRLWVAGKDVISFSAPLNGADFNTANGAGSFAYFGNKLVYTYTAMWASAGYLFVFGDSSTDTISNVLIDTTGGEAITLFNYLNADPQIGHNVPRKVGPFGRFMNTITSMGIFLTYGSDAQASGEKLTNLWATLDQTRFLPTLAPVTMFGKRFMLCNGEFTDPWGRKRSMLLVWDGTKWTVASQNLDLTHIGYYEQDTKIDAYGTDGTSLYHLFDHPDPALPKRLSTKLTKGAGISQITIKNFKRLFMELHDNFGGGVGWTGKLIASGGGIPTGSQDISFQLGQGENYKIIPLAVSGSGIGGALDLESVSPDFTVERIHIAAEERTLFGA